MSAIFTTIHVLALIAVTLAAMKGVLWPCFLLLAVQVLVTLIALKWQAKR